MKIGKIPVGKEGRAYKRYSLPRFKAKTRVNAHLGKGKHELSLGRTHRTPGPLGTVVPAAGTPRDAAIPGWKLPPPSFRPRFARVSPRLPPPRPLQNCTRR